MKRAIVLSVTLTLTIASTVLSQEPRRQDAEQAQKRQQAAFDQVFTLRGLSSARPSRPWWKNCGRSTRRS